MSRLNEMKKVLEDYGIELPKETTLVDADARVYDYWGYKHADSNSCIKNANVLLQLKHKNIEKPFWIAIFQGGQYKSAEETFIIASWKKPFAEEALYRQDGINKEDKEEGTEIVLALRDELNTLFFEDTEERDGLHNDNPDVIYDLANDIENIVCLNIHISKPLERVSLSDVEELKKAYEIAKEAYRNNEGKKLLKEILDDKKAPKLLKDFIKKQNISKILFEEYIDCDFIPYREYYMVLTDEAGENRYGFLSGYIGCYGTTTFPFQGMQITSKKEFAKILKKNELLVSEEERTKEINKEAFTTWKYLYVLSKEGDKRKLY